MGITVAGKSGSLRGLRAIDRGCEACDKWRKKEEKEDNNKIYYDEDQLMASDRCLANIILNCCTFR